VYWLYSIIMGAAFLAVLPKYVIEMRLLRGEPLRIAERLSLRRPSPKRNRPLVWIHAVSVGEALSLRTLLREIRAAYPGWEIGFSALTNAGYAVAREKLKDVDRLFLVPVDVGWCVRRVFRRLRPDLFVLVESEFWPRLLREAEKKRCPVLLINGRISEHSHRRMRRYRFLSRRWLGKIARFLVQTPLDRERLESIGVDPAKIEVSGNLKCDVRLPVVAAVDLARLRGELGIGPGRKTVVAGSIHPGEERQLLQAFREARRRRDDVLLILAPRHPDKFVEIENEFAGGDLLLRRRTTLAPGESWDVLLLDTIGELASFYAFSDAAFIGGSLVPHGGQNLLEPAFYGKAVFFGPSMENFIDLAKAFVLAGAAKVVSAPEELAEVFLFKDPEAIAEMGRRARMVLESLQGATRKTMAALAEFMERADA